MEKRRPHHDLEAFKRVCGNPQTLAITRGALQDAFALGFGRADIAGTLSRLTALMFYKSMTSYDDPREWQDVYHLPIGNGRYIYMKFKADKVTEFKVLSFKER